MKKKLIIIGGGATGACILYNVSRALRGQVEVIVIDPQPKELLGLGKAYLNTDEENLLNVAASNMGILYGEAAHFQDWLLSTGLVPDSFKHWPYVPRKIFGRYVQGCVLDSEYQHLQAKVEKIDSGTSSYELSLSDGSRLEANYLVIATGYREDRNTFEHLLKKAETSRLSFPREAEGLRFTASDSILIIGTSLTAIDVWKRHRKVLDLKITMVSRHGLLPLPNLRVKQELTHPFPRLTGMTPARVAHVVRRAKLGSRLEWQTIADEVRLQVPQIWSCWSDKEKRQFVRHLRPYWEMIRHRVAPDLSELLLEDIRENRVEIRAAHVSALKEEGGPLRVGLRPRSSTGEVVQNFDHVILATGAVVDQELFREHRPLGISRSPSGFGFVNDGAANLWFAGPASKASIWEIAAIPDIRVQSGEIVQEIRQCLIQASVDEL